MTKRLLWDVLNEAKQKGQVGLLIWSNWSVWDECAFDMKPGNKSYDFALSQISKGEEATISAEWNGFSMPGLIAVSVQKLSSSEEFLNFVLQMCEKGNYEGPITLVPLNELSENC